MSLLIAELKRDHEELASALQKIREIGVATAAGQELLKNVKAALLAHLAKEDKKLYPVLWQEAEKDVRLKHTLEIFASEMNNISKAAMDFFDKYDEGGQGMKFTLDFVELFAALGQRIQKEESVIYAKFEQLERSREQKFGTR